MVTTSYRLKSYLWKERNSLSVVLAQFLGVSLIGLAHVLGYGQRSSACLSALTHNRKWDGPRLNDLNELKVESLKVTLLN